MAELTKEQVEALVKENAELAKQNEALSKDLEKAKSKDVKQNFKIAKDASVSHSIEVESLKGDKYHEDGEKFLVGEKNAIALAQAKKVKITGKFTNQDLHDKAKKLGLLSLLLIALMSFAAPSFSQTGAVANFESIYGFTSDTLTLSSATGTVYLTSPLLKQEPATTTTVRFTITEYSGTTAGTATLMGSMTENGTYKAITTPNTVTALATHTVADAASAVYDWVITGSPFPYLRVSWTATTATFSSKIEAVVFRSK